MPKEHFIWCHLVFGGGHRIGSFHYLELVKWKNNFQLKLQNFFLICHATVMFGLAAPTTNLCCLQKVATKNREGEGGEVDKQYQETGNC